MTKSQKIWLGVLTFLPFLFMILYVFLFLGTFFFGFVEMERTHDDGAGIFVSGILIAILFLFLGLILNIGLLVYYILHAYKNEKFDNTLKLIWVLIFLFGGGIGSIVYYFVEIVPNGRKTSD
jgi:heme/copper-type cytochrome/quinol oxidase subunit 2